MELENLLGFYSHLISPLPGSVLWLWTALPAALLNTGPWAGGPVGELLSSLWTHCDRKAHLSPPRAGPLCAQRAL